MGVVETRRDRITPTQTARLRFAPPRELPDRELALAFVFGWLAPAVFDSERRRRTLVARERAADVLRG